MVLNKILDQYLSSYQILTKSIKGFRNNEVLKTLTFVDANAYANVNAGGSTIALRELRSNELKMANFTKLLFCQKTSFWHQTCPCKCSMSLHSVGKVLNCFGTHCGTS